MSEIDRFIAPRSFSRATGRSLANIDAATDVARARTFATADIAATKVQAVLGVTQQAMAGAACISQIEVALTEANPSSMGYVRQIAQSGVSGLSQIVVDTAVTLRRI